MQAVFLDFDTVSFNDDVNLSPIRDLTGIDWRFHGSTRPGDVGYGTPAVVRHVHALIPVLTARLPSYLHAIAEGRWQHHYQFCILDYPIRELRNLTASSAATTGPSSPGFRSTSCEGG